jgi:hypothetical protein
MNSHFIGDVTFREMPVELVTCGRLTGPRKESWRNRGAVDETGVGEILRRCLFTILCYFLLIFKRLKTG